MVLGIVQSFISGDHNKILRMILDGERSQAEKPTLTRRIEGATGYLSSQVASITKRLLTLGLIRKVTDEERKRLLNPKGRNIRIDERIELLLVTDKGKEVLDLASEYGRNPSPELMSRIKEVLSPDNRKGSALSDE